MDIPAEWRFDQLTEQQIGALVAITIAVGTLYCFLGYRTLKFMIGLTGFLAAGLTATALAGMVFDGRVLYMIAAGLLGGICGAFALTFIYKLGIFVVGALGGTLALQNLLADNSATWAPFAVLGGGLAAGGLALVIEQPVITLATSVLGAWLMVSGVAYFFFDADWVEGWATFLRDHDERTMFLIAWGVLSLAGAMAQFATRKKKDGD